jgi:hypothetical protein
LKGILKLKKCLRGLTLVVDDGLGLVAADVEEDDPLVGHEQRPVLLDLQIVHDALPAVAALVQQAQRSRQDLELPRRLLQQPRATGPLRNWSTASAQGKDDHEKLTTVRRAVLEAAKAFCQISSLS